MSPLAWLEKYAPGFSERSHGERNAIANFALLWSLFEAQVLDTRGDSDEICAMASEWEEMGRLSPPRFSDELAYYRARYFRGGEFTYHFEKLRVAEKYRPLVMGVLSGKNIRPSAEAAALFIVIHRLRNNYFHGPKWAYEFADQERNFFHANNAMMKAIEIHEGLKGLDYERPFEELRQSSM